MTRQNTHFHFPYTQMRRKLHKTFQIFKQKTQILFLNNVNISPIIWCPHVRRYIQWGQSKFRQLIRMSRFAGKETNHKKNVLNSIQTTFNSQNLPFVELLLSFNWNPTGCWIFITNHNTAHSYSKTNFWHWFVLKFSVFFLIKNSFNRVKRLVKLTLHSFM